MKAKQCGAETPLSFSRCCVLQTAVITPAVGGGRLMGL